MNSPAETVIAKCGGPKVVAEILGLDLSTVYRFAYARERGGTGGVIPAQHQGRLLTEARNRGIHLSPEDFFEPAVPAPSQSAEAAQ